MQFELYAAVVINSKLGGLRGGEAARPREPAALRVAARVDPGRPEPRVPLRDLECQNNKKFQISIIYCLAATPSSTSLCRTNSLLIHLIHILIVQFLAFV